MAEIRAHGPAPGGFPWGDNRPTRNQRIVVTAIIAIVSATLHYFRGIENRGRSDFSPLWHAARLMFSGDNPYALIGPGNVIESSWPMFYPAPAFVAAAPFALIPSFAWASTAFVFVSVALLTWGVTRDGWHRLPMFPSIAFLTSATLAQWSIIMTAALYLPFLGFLVAAKPQSGLPVMSSARDRTTWYAAVAGGVVLVAVSFILLPGWVADWRALLATTDNFVAPVMRFAGPAILLVLLRWRRPESWLVAIAACMPQTWPPYNGLMLMTVARTYHEAAFLSLFSSFGWVTYAWFADNIPFERERVLMSGVLNLCAYLPAVLLILRRPNEGPSPLWLEWLLARAGWGRTSTR